MDEYNYYNPEEAPLPLLMKIVLGFTFLFTIMLGSYMLTNNNWKKANLIQPYQSPEKVKCTKAGGVWIQPRYGDNVCVKPIPM